MGKDDRRVDRALKKARERIETIDDGTTMAQRLARAAKSSELLSAVWTLPPAQRLMFHPGVQVDRIDGGSTPGFGGGKDEAERFIELSAAEIARYQSLLYANGARGSHRRLLM